MAQGSGNGAAVEFDADSSCLMNFHLKQKWRSRWKPTCIMSITSVYTGLLPFTRKPSHQLNVFVCFGNQTDPSSRPDLTRSLPRYGQNLQP